MRLSDLFYLWKEALGVSRQSLTQLWTIFTAHKKSCVKPYNFTCVFRWMCLYLVVDIFMKINSSGNWFPDLWNFGGQLQILHLNANYCPFQLPFHLKWKCTDWMATFTQLRCLKMLLYLHFKCPHSLPLQFPSQIVSFQSLWHYLWLRRETLPNLDPNTRRASETRLTHVCIGICTHTHARTIWDVS